MDSKDIEPGGEYAVREPNRFGEPFQRVRVIERVRSGRWKAEWREPEPGLVDYVQSRHIVVPWKLLRAYQRDEARWIALKSASDREWPGKDHPLGEAVDDVLAATGENVSVYSYGLLSEPRDAIERIAGRAGVEVDDPSGFVDRNKVRHLPFRTALALAKAFAAAEPRPVLQAIEAQEREDEVALMQPGNTYLVPLVSERRAAWASCRQWAGHD